MLTDKCVKEIEGQLCRVQGRKINVIVGDNEYFLHDPYTGTESSGMSEVEMEKMLVEFKQSKTADSSYHFDSVLRLLGFEQPTARTPNTYFSEALQLHVPTAITPSELMDVVKEHCIGMGQRVEKERQKQSIVNFLTTESALSDALVEVLKQYM